MIKFKKLAVDAIVPARQTSGAAGFDIHAYLGDFESTAVSAGDYVVIDTKIAVAIPAGYVGLIQPRSGWAVKNGIDKMAGVIDSDYRGEIKVILTKHSAGDFSINHGDRIAQLVVVPAMLDNCTVDELDETDRGAGGFGSTGA